MYLQSRSSEILEGVAAAYALQGEEKEFIDWLCEIACDDLCDDTDNVVTMSADLVSRVVNCSTEALLEADKKTQKAILIAHQAFQAIGKLRAAPKEMLIRYAEEVLSEVEVNAGE